jgi:hypothetical protein
VYDLIIRGGYLVDPKNGIRQPADVAVEGGCIAAVAAGLSGSRARRVLDVEGLTVIPGIIDPHVHLTSWIGGPEGYAMLARAGVTTAVDFSGPVQEILDSLPAYGCGLNIAVLDALHPGENLSGNDPGRAELSGFIDRSLARGALGIKILGGHYPLTPEATARAIALAAGRNAYLAFHAGSTATRSDLDGVREAVDLIAGHPAHLAHLNSYCRGLVAEPLQEFRALSALLEGRRHIVRESYLARINGTSGACRGRAVASEVTGTCLRTGGFDATRAGLEAAIRAGWARVQMRRGEEIVLAGPEEGEAAWRAAGTEIGISFAVNDPRILFLCAASREQGGRFLADAFSSDGGAIPRNVIAASGLSLVDFGALSLEDFVRKSSLNPAQMLGLTNKGHLGPGADADLTVLDTRTRCAAAAVCNGRVILEEGKLSGRGGKLLAAPEGAAELRAAGLDFAVVEPEARAAYRL